MIMFVFFYKSCMRCNERHIIRFLLLQKVISNVQGSDTFNVQTKIRTISIH